MAELRPEVVWRLSGRLPVTLDARIGPLLAGVAERGSLTAAAAALGIPYRTAWAALEGTERALGRRLIDATRGRGAALTPLGRRLLDAGARVERLLEARDAEVSVPLRAGPLPDLRRPLRIAASHDLVLAQVRPAWRARHRIAIDFHGSAESLALFAQGRADLAGFHAPAGSWTRDPLLALLRPDRDVLIRFLRRMQGLILSRGNPRRVHSLRDVARMRLRFVNRQPGSGTRALVDHALSRARIRPTAIVGYTNEEFTHAAVAATIAAGNADAGMGIAAAASQLGLAFVPLIEERYTFACRRRMVAGDVIADFRELLASGPTRGVIAPLPGYALDAPGEVVAIGGSDTESR